VSALAGVLRRHLTEAATALGSRRSSRTRATERRVGLRLAIATAGREEHAVDAVLDLRAHAHAVGEGDRGRPAPERLAHHVAVRLAERRVHEDVGVRVEVAHLA
jgi:hypothetical protein